MGRCEQCGKEGDGMRRCGKCRAAIYCSVKCQRDAWLSGHRNKCVASVSAAKQTALPGGTVVFSGASQAAPSDNAAQECAICLEGIRIPAALPCKHEFCLACVFNLRQHGFKDEMLCPLCRAPAQFTDPCGKAQMLHLDAVIIVMRMNTWQVQHDPNGTYRVPASMRKEMLRVEPMVRQAIALDPDNANLSQWHYLIGTVLVSLRDRAGMESALRLAMATNDHASNLETLLQLGIGRRSFNDYAGAETAFRDALALDGNDVRVLYNFGQMRENPPCSDHEGALELYRRAMGTAPLQVSQHMRHEYVGSHFNGGTILHMRGDHAGAAELYSRAIEFDPKMEHAGDCLFNLAQMQLLLYQEAPPAGSAELLEKAELAAMRYAKLRPQDPDAWAKIKHIKALREIKKSCALEDEASALLNGNPFGNVVTDPARRPRLQNVRDRLLEAVSRRPESVLFGMLGEVECALGDTRAATAAFRKASNFDSPSAYDVFTLGRLSEDADEKIRCFKKASAVDPKWPNPYKSLSDVLMSRGEFEGAIVALENAIRVAGPSYEHLPGCYCNLSGAFMQTRKFKQASEAVRKALVLEPRNAHFLTQHGILLTHMGQIPAALAATREAIRCDPGSKFAQTALGSLLAMTGDEAGSIATLRKAIELNPKCADALFNLGQLYMESDPQEGLELLRRSFAINPNRAECNARLVHALQKTENKAEAMSLARITVARFPDDVDAHNALALTLLGGPTADGKDGKIEAIGVLKQALRIDPDSVVAKANLKQLRGFFLEAATGLRALEEQAARQVSGSEEAAAPMRELAAVFMAHVQACDSNDPESGASAGTAGGGRARDAKKKRKKKKK